MPSHVNTTMMDQTDMACWISKYSSTNQHENKDRNKLYDNKQPQNRTPCKGMVIADQSLQQLGKIQIK